MRTSRLFGCCGVRHNQRACGGNSHSFRNAVPTTGPLLSTALAQRESYPPKYGVHVRPVFFSYALFSQTVPSNRTGGQERQGGNTQIHWRVGPHSGPGGMKAIAGEPDNAITPVSAAPKVTATIEPLNATSSFFMAFSVKRTFAHHSGGHAPAPRIESRLPETRSNRKPHKCGIATAIRLSESRRRASGDTRGLPRRVHGPSPSGLASTCACTPTGYANPCGSAAGRGGGCEDHLEVAGAPEFAHHDSVPGPAVIEAIRGRTW